MSNDKAKRIAALKAGISEIKISLDRKDYSMVREINEVMAEIVVELEDIERGEDETETY